MLSNRFSRSLAGGQKFAVSFLKTIATHLRNSIKLLFHLIDPKKISKLSPITATSKTRSLAFKRSSGPPLHSSSLIQQGGQVIPSRKSNHYLVGLSVKC